MGKVEVYGKSSCSTCMMLVRWLDENHISFEYNDVGKYPDMIQELLLMTGNMTLPQFRYEGTWYHGFDLTGLRRLFNKY